MISMLCVVFVCRALHVCGEGVVQSAVHTGSGRSVHQIQPWGETRLEQHRSCQEGAANELYITTISSNHTSSQTPIKKLSYAYVSQLTLKINHVYHFSRAGALCPSNKMTDQMSLYDFGINYFACNIVYHCTNVSKHKLLYHTKYNSRRWEIREIIRGNQVSRSWPVMKIDISTQEKCVTDADANGGKCFFLK